MFLHETALVNKIVSECVKDTSIEACTEPQHVKNTLCYWLRNFYEEYPQPIFSNQQTKQNRLNMEKVCQKYQIPFNHWKDPALKNNTCVCAYTDNSIIYYTTVNGVRYSITVNLPLLTHLLKYPDDLIKLHHLVMLRLLEFQALNKPI